MDFHEINGRIYINIDESTHLEYDLEELKDKIELIPTAYMSSEERKDLEEFLKKHKLCPL